MTRSQITRLGVHAVLFAYVLLAILPILLVVMNSFKSHDAIFGSPLAPPNAVPFQTRPVTSWNGLVAISLPDSATPITTETPQPRWQASNAWRMTVVLPVQSKV